MNAKPVILYLCMVILAAVLGGCTSSSELEEENESLPAADSVAAPPVVVKVPAPVQTNKQGFTTKEDTIEVESAQRNHRPEHTPVVVQRQPASANASFAVQIGAFRNEANARHAKAVLEKRFRVPAQIVFDEAAKLYKVSAGSFATEKQAMRLAATMKKKYPRDYTRAWVIRRP